MKMNGIGLRLGGGLKVLKLGEGFLLEEISLLAGKAFWQDKGNNS
jgi:hypothetical protein